MKEDKISIVGGCRCGELRFKASDAPFDGTFCHCSMCRKSTGELFSIGVMFNWSDFQIMKGKPKYYRPSELGKYAFCDNCGSTIFGAYEGSPSLYVSLGSLDNPDDWPFSKDGWSGHVFVDDKVSWYEINDGLAQHAASAGYYDASRSQTKDEQKP